MLLIGEGQSFGAASTLATAELKGYPGRPHGWGSHKKQMSIP